MPDRPHVEFHGAPLSRARLAAILLHGRGAGAGDMIGLAQGLALTDVAFFAPQAEGRSWWPHSFLAPIEANEPGITNALAVVERTLADLAAAGFDRDRVVLIGFSQGACLALEAIARGGRPLHAAFALSGGLIGTATLDEPPRDELYGHSGKAFDYSGDLAGMPIHVGSHAQDPVIPEARVRRSAEILSTLGADVSLSIVPGAHHGVSEEDVRAIRGRLNLIA